MDFSEICRTCLSINNLNPIFISEDQYGKYSTAIFLCTGIQVDLNDGLPQNMCTECMLQLNNILKFRKQCQLVKTQLLKIKSKLESDTVVTSEKYFSKITKNIPKNTTNKQVIVNNPSLVIDVDEDKPLKLYIHNNNDSVSPNKVNENIQTYNRNEDKPAIDLKTTMNKTENDLKQTEKTFLENIDSTCNDMTHTEQFKMIVLSQIPQKYNNIESDLFEFSNNDDLNDLSEDLDAPVSSAKTILKEDDKKGINIPYNFVRESFSNKTMRVVCKLCQKELSIRSIDTHMAKRHPGADERKVKCELCDNYVMKEKLNRHKIMMHGSIGAKCGYCKLEFKSQEVLVDHVTTCTAKKRRRSVKESGRVMAECDICKKTMQKASLKMHKAVKHAGLRPVCEHCGRSFGNKLRLNEHYRAKHGYEKFQCSYCDFRSAGIMAMRNHERRHRGEKPFVCETCGAKFHAAYLLTQHKHSHRTDKLVKCDLCPASFKANNSLHMHKLTCHSKSLYRCTICSRSYKCRYYAVKHARIAHSATGTPPVVKITS